MSPDSEFEVTEMILTLTDQEGLALSIKLSELMTVPGRNVS